MAKSKSGEEEDAPANEPLSALDLPAAPPVPIDTRDIPLTEIQQLVNIRPNFRGIEGLAETMHTEGQLEPCRVRPTPEGAVHGRPFELVYGYRRYLAAESLGWPSLRCEVHEVPDENLRRQLIIENFQREALSSLGEAKAMYELKYTASPPLSNAEVARQLGCDPSQVSHRLTMLIKLAPPRPEGAPLRAHEIAEQKALAAPEEGVDSAAATEDHEASESELDPAANTPLAEAPKGGSGLAVVTPPGPLVLPGDLHGDDEAPPELDILALVDAGTISASTAETIASLDTREDQEQLTRLVLRHGWGVKKASAWVRDSKRSEAAHAADEEEIGPVEMIGIADVTPLQSLRLRPDVSAEQIERIVLYSQLRNGMDQEMLDFIAERLGYGYEALWDYVSLLSDDEVAELKRRMAVRYVSAAHRFFALESSLKDAFGIPEDAADDAQREAASAAALALPGEEFTAALGSGEDDFLALGPKSDDEDDEDDE
jgi:ParB-like chromosome segregation protein Spo0J